MVCVEADLREEGVEISVRPPLEGRDERDEGRDDDDICCASSVNENDGDDNNVAEELLEEDKGEEDRAVVEELTGCEAGVEARCTGAGRKEPIEALLGFSAPFITQRLP